MTGMIVALLSCCGHSAVAAFITEVATVAVAGHDVTWPAYIEINVSGTTSPFDLVIANGNPTSNLQVLSRMTIDPGGYQMVVIHESNWPVMADSRLLTLGVDDMGLVTNGSGPNAGTSRWLMVFDRVLEDWPTAGIPPLPIKQWQGIDDGLGFYWGDGWSIDNTLPYRTYALPSGGAIAMQRSLLFERPLTATRGDVDADLHFSNGYELTPGWLNPYIYEIALPTHAPEPASLAALLMISFMTARRTPRRP